MNLFDYGRFVEGLSPIARFVLGKHRFSPSCTDRIFSPRPFVLVKLYRTPWIRLQGLAHIKEQQETGKLIRPNVDYIGAQPSVNFEVDSFELKATAL